jgi:hypothetical protein
MNQRMPKGKPPKVFQGVHARLVGRVKMYV